MDIRDLICPPGNYTEADRYRDFRAVFAGDRGARVLTAVLHECGLLRSIYDMHLGPEGPAASAAPADEIMRRAGKREIGLWLLGVLYTEAEAPTVDGMPLIEGQDGDRE